LARNQFKNYMGNSVFSWEGFNGGFENTTFEDLVWNVVIELVKWQRRVFENGELVSCSAGCLVIRRSLLLALGECLWTKVEPMRRGLLRPLTWRTTSSIPLILESSGKAWLLWPSHASSNEACETCQSFMKRGRGPSRKTQDWLLHMWFSEGGRCPHLQKGEVSQAHDSVRTERRCWQKCSSSRVFWPLS
jgi:hypothetical protein